MDNVITFQISSAEREEDLGELWERMQANLTAVSSSRVRASSTRGPELSPPQPCSLQPGHAGRQQMGSLGTEVALCSSAKWQPATVSPGGPRHLTAGRSRVTCITAAGGGTQTSLCMHGTWCWLCLGLGAKQSWGAQQVGTQSLSWLSRKGN